MVDEYQARRAGLPDDSLRVVLDDKLQGYTHEEIAARMGCTVRTVERKIATIRGVWAQETDP